MKKIINYLLLLVILSGCSDNSHNNQGLSVDFGFSKLSDDKIESVIKEYKLIPLETKDECYITKARKIIIRNKRIYILTKNSGRQYIYIFSTEGKLIGSINKQGRGPEEYQRIGDFDVNPKNNLISVLDPGLRKVISYNNKSEYVSELKLNCWAKTFSYFLNNNELFMAYSTMLSNPKGEKGNELYVYDDNNNLLYSTLPFQQELSIGLGNGISFINSLNEIHYLRPNSNFIYTITKEATKIKYQLNFPYNVLPGKEIKKVFFEGKSDLLKNHVYNNYAFETNKFLFSLFMYQKKVYWSLYNKETFKSIVFNEQKDPTCGCKISLNIKGGNNDYFILEAEYNKIKNVLNIIDPEMKKCSNPEIFNTIEKLDMTSNPILVLLKFKL